MLEVCYKGVPPKMVAKLYGISYRRMLDICRAGKFGAKKEEGRWVLSDLPIREMTVSVRTIADTLGCSRRYVRRLCEQERVLAVHIGREWRVGVSEASKLALIRLNLRGISE